MRFLEFIAEHWDILTTITLAIISGISTIVVAIKNKNWQKLCEFAKVAIKEAEKFRHYTGEEKKAYVMTKVSQFAKDKGIKFDTNKVSNFIEDVVKLSKEVNIREKDKVNN